MLLRRSSTKGKATPLVKEVVEDAQERAIRRAVVSGTKGTNSPLVLGTEAMPVSTASTSHICSQSERPPVACSQQHPFPLLLRLRVCK